jgi:hypothetical protein
MGNNSSSWFSIKTLEEEEKEKTDKEKLKNNLTEYDITMNTIKHENMFKGTIIICIVYAIFGFLLLLLSYFSESVRDLLFNKFLYFTLIYIIGSIIIIFIMLYYIYTFEHTKINRYNDIDEISCPDYWNVQIIDDNYIGDSFDANYANEFKYRCVLNDKIFDKKQMFKYHNNKNYRMTNNFSNIDNRENYIGKYLDTKDVNFNADYINNKDLYNLYVDVNNYSTNPSGISSTFIENKKKLTKDLNIYNDLTRVDNIYSNLRKISLLQNNYEINDSNNATNLLLKPISTNNNNTKQIINPNINFSIWPKDNLAINIVLNSSESNNALQIIKWTNISKDQLDNLFLNTTNYNVVALKIGIETTASLTYYCLGLIKKDNTDSNNIKYYYYPTPNGSGFRNVAATYLNVIFPHATAGSLSANVRETDIDKYNLIFKTTKLFKIVDISTNNDYNDYNDYNNITSVGTVVSNIRIDDLGMPGPYIQAYDKTKYNLINISKENLHNADNANSKDNYQIPLLCDTVYPKLFARFEKEDINNENHNDIRCAYSKICGIPWSDLRCPSN